MKNKIFAFLSSFILLIGCSKEDDNPGNINNFFDGADSSAAIEELAGAWAIFNAEFEGEKIDIPINFSECGRDFFVYSENGIYSEYIFESNDCRPNINRLNWSLIDGVLTLSNSLGQSDELVITKLNSQELVFKSRFDVDEDGELDVLILFARKYNPRDIDFYSQTFTRNQDGAFEDLISFTWDEYQGPNTFNRYEIYRSDSCTTNDAQLIATIEDASTNMFTDLDPPNQEEICYFLRIYVDDNLLGQSQLQGVSTWLLNVQTVNLDLPSVQNDQIFLDWDEYKGEYFSHYQITINDREPGTLLGEREIVLTEITDKSVTSYLDESPPYFSNPVYTVKTINIFGTVSFINTDYANSSQEVSFIREGQLNFQDIDFVTIDQEEPIIYFYGREWNTAPPTFNIHRFNYETQRTERISNNNPMTSFEADMEIVSSGHGKELLVEQADEIFVYDASTLQFKYAMTDDNVFFSIDDFVYLDNDIVMVIDSREIFTFKRVDDSLNFIDSREHDIENGNSNGYKLISLSGTSVLAGHFNSEVSILYSVDDSGLLQDPQNTPIRFSSDFSAATLYNNTANLIFNTSEKRLYSAETYDLLENIQQPNFPTGISRDGNLILGSNNDPEWRIEPESEHKKEVVVFGRMTQAVEIITAKGYPLLVFEDSNGQLISISAGLKRNRLRDFADRAEIFVEILTDR